VPAAARRAIIARDALLAGHVLSVAHLPFSTAGSARFFCSGQEQVLAVSAEVTPHHLLLTDDLAETLTGLQGQSAPAHLPRTSKPCAPVWPRATIDCLATDHARTHP